MDFEQRNLLQIIISFKCIATTIQKESLGMKEEPWTRYEHHTTPTLHV